MNEVHLIVPGDVDDPARPSGGNVYDRELRRGLERLGWKVHEHPVPGAWPRPAADARASLARALQRIPDRAVVLIDGLLGSAAPEALVPHAGRLRQVPLVHMPLGHNPPAGAGSGRAREREALWAAVTVVATSAWGKARLTELYGLAPERIHVAEPGVHPAPLAPGSAAGGALLCVATVSPQKGHDVLLDGLAKVSELPWRCMCVGSLARAPDFAERVRSRADGDGLGRRVRFTGPLTGARLESAYAAADLLVLPSRAETYGMVVSEALARGVPVLATEVGGVPEALGRGPGGSRPGLLVPPEDPAALGAALRRWLADAELRGRLREVARARRGSLRRWDETAEVVAWVLAGVAR